MTVPHTLLRKSDRSDLRSVNVTVPPKTVRDEPLSPTPTKGMQERLQKIEDLGTKGRALIVGCDGMWPLLFPRDFKSQCHERYAYDE